MRENDRSYFTRRAAQEHSAATKARGKAREAHERMEERYRDLANCPDERDVANCTVERDAAPPEPAA